MKKIIKSILITCTLLFIVSQILINSASILDSVTFALDIWKDKLFPSLFPFFVISSLLINYGFVEFVSEVFKPFMTIFFRTSGNSSFIFIMSIISGIPSNAKYINDLLDKKMIDINEAEKLLMFTHFSNPLFILGTVGILFFNNYRIGLLILGAHYISNIIIGICVRNYHPIDSNISFSLKKAIIDMDNKRTSSETFGKVLTKALLDAINTLMLILGVITFFLIITTIINSQMNLNPLAKSIISGLFEMTQGLSFISTLDISMKVKIILATMIISFGGFSCHMQVISILSEKKIRYLPYLVSRIIHALLSGIIIYIYLTLWLIKSIVSRYNKDHKL